MVCNDLKADHQTIIKQTKSTLLSKGIGRINILVCFLEIRTKLTAAIILLCCAVAQLISSAPYIYIMDDDVSLPKATLQKIIKDHIGSDLRIAGEATEMLVASCTEFVQLLASEANEIATKEKKSTIQPEHVMKALTELGFSEFIPDVTIAWDEHKADAKTASSHKAALRKTGADQAGYTEAEQIAMQQQMFAAAKARSLTSADGAAAMAATYHTQLAAMQQPSLLPANEALEMDQDEDSLSPSE